MRARPRTTIEAEATCTAPARLEGGAIELAPLPDMVGYALRRAQVAVFRNFARTFADLDIRPTQLGILTVIGNNPGCRPSEVGAALGIKRTNIVSLLDGLALRGLVSRGRVLSDRRSHALNLTPAGLTLMAELRRREAEHEAQVTARIGAAGRHRLLALLAEVSEACAELPGASEDD